MRPGRMWAAIRICPLTVTKKVTVTIAESEWIPLITESPVRYPADSVRTMISCPWHTGTYRSSSSAHCGRLMERFGVAMQFIPWDCIRERSARPSASKGAVGRFLDAASLPNPAVYENQGGAECGAAGPASAPGLCLGRLARAHAGPLTGGTFIKAAQTGQRPGSARNPWLRPPSMNIRDCFDAFLYRA